MTIFLKGHKLWRYVTGLIPKPMPIPKSKAAIDADVSKTTVVEHDYEALLEEWESIQSKILSWFINSFVPSMGTCKACRGRPRTLPSKPTHLRFPHLPFIVFFLVLVLLWLLGYFCPVVTIALIIQA